MVVSASANTPSSENWLGSARNSAPGSSESAVVLGACSATVLRGDNGARALFVGASPTRSPRIVAADLESGALERSGVLGLAVGEQASDEQPPDRADRDRIRDEYGIAPDEMYQLHNLLTDQRHLVKGSRYAIRLDPQVEPAAVYAVRRWTHREQEFDYFL